uniref:Uncharacterized protein n=1 Tax=viral metagenome TaxID=1070528 RepID=A0A6C0EDR3_9ZZZZ
MVSIINSEVCAEIAGIIQSPNYTPSYPECVCEICGWSGENTGWGPTYCSRRCATSDPRAYADEDEDPRPPV